MRHPAAIAEQRPGLAPVERPEREWPLQAIDDGEDGNTAKRLRDGRRGYDDHQRGAEDHRHDDRGDLAQTYAADLDHIDQQKLLATFERPDGRVRNQRQRQEASNPGKRPGHLRPQLGRQRNEMTEQKPAQDIQDRPADQAHAAN